MSTTTYHLTLDLKRDLHQVLVMKESDANSRKVNITITDNGKKFTIGNNTVCLYWKKPDRHMVTIDQFEKTDPHSVCFTCTQQMLIAPGIVQAELCIIDQDFQLSTMPFQVSIKPASISESDLTSSDEFQSLLNLMHKFQEEHDKVKAEVERLKNEAIFASKESKSYAHGNTLPDRVDEAIDNAKFYKEQAASSAERAKDFSNSAKSFSESAAQSKASASESKTQAERHAMAASNSATASQQNAQSASNNAILSQSYAVGDTGKRAGEKTDNAKYYYQQSKSLAESFSGALRPMGTVEFSKLPSLTSAAEGDMYNVSNQFTTTTAFKEGSGIVVSAGSNVYKTSDGYWDVLAGSPVSGIKGNAESSYRRGNVNLTPANIGAVSETYLNGHFVPDHVSSFKGSAGSKGWYRIAKAVGTPGGNSCVISMKRGYNTPSPEYQKVQLINAYDTQRFSPLAAICETHMWTKIRCTRDNANSTTYIELYQDRDNSSNTWLVTIEDAQGVYTNHWKAIAPTLTSETTSGVTVLASMNLPSWFDSRAVTDNGNGNNISFSFQKSGMTNASWLAAWNNYELRAIAPGNITGVGSAVKATNDGSGNNIVNTYAKKGIYSDTAISLGRKSETTVGLNSVALGYLVTASGNYSYAGGMTVRASGYGSYAYGLSTTASGDYSYTRGMCTTASKDYSSACGVNTKSSGYGSYACGLDTEASGDYSHAGGSSTAASNYASHASGKYNKTMTGGGTGSTQVGDVFVIGNGTSTTARSNALRVTYLGNIYGTKAFQSSGADYAEFIKPWADGNPDAEDRIGYFVTVKDGFLEKAAQGDLIAGITSGNPSIVGNADEDYYWRYERDEFNRIVMEDVPETIQQTDEDGNLVFHEETHEPVMVETGNIIKNARMKLAKDYDPSQQESYIERKDRKEWDYVGMLGVLPLRDDGTCLPNHFCKCKGDGIATHAPERGFDTYQVIERISENVISVILR